MHPSGRMAQAWFPAVEMRTRIYCSGVPICRVKVDQSPSFPSQYWLGDTAIGAGMVEAAKTNKGAIRVSNLAAILHRAR